ncbi:GHKL domain-containing protein [Gemmata sp. G18]|uniref:histidine kinase n=1 Tax=Gemmata palustris TaxID=2822762 RepID=A0ABS5BZ81_9BACT|nr:ATP-binding protein [Gemmata palustris]MBP3959035.1 GHKL domain-containing protein [Gemmata palustris]
MMRRVRATRPAVLALVLVATVFAVDLCLPLGVASAVPYTFAVLIALGAKPAWVGPTVAVLCAVLTFAKMEIVPERGNTEMWKVIVNRCLALFAIGMTTLLGVLRRRAEAKVRQHEADLARMSRLAVAGELATVLAHELNQPLAAVCLQADMAALLATESTSGELRAALDEVAEQSHRAAEIVRSIRHTVRRTSAERGSVDLNEVVRVVARLLDWRARRTGVSVELHLAADPLPPTYGDRVQLEQVLFNLLQNAIEAVEAGSGPRTVVMETLPEGDWLTVRVRDTGPGLADPKRAFEQFYTTKPDGMGLGLAISRSIVVTHGGALTAATRPEGGAELTCVLPIYREEKA